MSLKGGVGTKKRLRCLTLWSLIWMDKMRGIDRLQVRGDSKAIIDWAKGVSTINVLSIDHWMRRVKDQILGFLNLSFKHVHREVNGLVYDL